MCDAHREDVCCISGIGPMRGLIKAWLLLRLSVGRAHGYQLLEYLKRDDVMGHADPGLLYRTLRQFEHEGDVTSTWSTEGVGPARRVYEITERGRVHLAGCKLHVCAARERLDRCLEAFAHREAGHNGGDEADVPDSSSDGARRTGALGSGCLD